MTVRPAAAGVGMLHMTPGAAAALLLPFPTSCCLPYLAIMDDRVTGRHPPLAIDFEFVFPGALGDEQRAHPVPALLGLE